MQTAMLARPWRALMAAVASGLTVQDANGTIVDCNPAAEGLLGLSRDQILGRTLTDPRWRALDAEGYDLPGHLHPAMHTLRSGEPVNGFEMGVALPSGERRWIVVGTRLLAVDGLNWVVCTFEASHARRKLEHSLSDPWQRLIATLEGAGVATWEWQVDSGVLRPNERWAQMLGWQLADLAPLNIETWMALLHPEDREACRTLLEAHRAGRVPVFDIECRLRHRDGSWHWVRERGRMAGPARAGDAAWMLGTREDITERKSAELAASRTLAMLKGLFELMPVGISLMDMTSSRAVDVNDALCEMLGYSREEMLSMDLSVCTPPELRSQRAEKFNRALDLGHCGTYESVLLHRDGHAVDVLRSGARIISPDGRPHVWSVAQDITARKAMEQQMLMAATLDRLTGLPNRATLTRDIEALSQRAREQADFRFGVLFLDFDRFKLVNDTLGHAAGDELLCAVARRIQAAVTQPGVGGSDWCVARFGGDEFVVLAPGLATPQAAHVLGRALRDQLEQPYLIKGKEIHSSASIGVAFSQGRNTRAETLMRDADTAMYEAKRAGRATLVVFDDTMRARLTRAVQIESGLRGAHLRGEMHLVYQPIVDLETAQVGSAEALLRWRHPELGPVSPAEFIPIAEESGAILDLGAWVLRRACEQWTRWQRDDPAHAPAVISVNLSRLQITLDEALPGQVQGLLSDLGMPAGALQLEITERAVAKASHDMRAPLAMLNALGVRLAMDDFGAGASSLGFLREHPFHTIKIDKSFVTDLCRDPQVLAVAHATIQLVENLGMVSVAEGIEEPGELATLQSLGCRCGQGFLLSRPVGGDELPGVVRNIRL
jgi:diguanylate cyclase (GGDEF)-like protein/PAS domain S-box-containing protein